MLDNKILKYLCCPKCKSKLLKNDIFLVCEQCQNKLELISGNIIKTTQTFTQDLKLSVNKWESFYQKQFKSKSYTEEQKRYLINYYKDTYQQINEYKKIKKNLVYLELGCGPMFFGQKVVNKCKLVIGVDFCLSALKIAREMFLLMNIKNYILIQGDILNMPIRNNCIDLVYGGGVIEHFKNTQQCVNEIYRVLNTSGVSFNTVPCLNIGSLTYRQIWGNIPNLPILKQIAEFIHVKLLQGRHMIFGYELSFLKSTLKKIHKNSGFRKVIVDKLFVKLAFDFLPTKFLKKICCNIANKSRLFWPMFKVIAQK